MASTPATKIRIAASVLFAAGFWDAIAGRFTWESRDSPPAPPSEVPSAWRDLRGALHVHTNYSDGASDVPTVLQAARDAQVDFVLLCDHNTLRPLRDGWEEKFPEKPWLLIGTEVTVAGGAFLLALDMPPGYEPVKNVPAQEAIDAVRRENGLPLVSLPYDVKHPWLDWNTTGYEGLEVLNLSTVARAHINLLSVTWLLTIWRTGGTMAAMRALVTRPDASLARWDALMQHGTRRMVGIGALDAHALMKIGKKKYPIPSYADSFRAATTHVLIPDTSPSPPKRAIYDALREGRCYFSYDCLGDPTGFSFTMDSGHELAVMGEVLPMASDGARINARIVEDADTNVLVRVLHNGKIIAAGARGHVSCSVKEAGAYRIEAYRYSARAGAFFWGIRPWIFTNPIYARNS